ncbi:NlpC/P60 family protein [Treponema socranskii subsp. socranskii VPI DR56BR1116 = ATCC 35536]|uniref:NlpC/P60 family protein n=1 Tax=Treponema socranskii subsp. socranskii VPI DR56BR1116 = ATCC 35536 TaxID=1125725 RepID=U1FC10_TRESO|nr:NlpC/P60 family protein [Treponema socranskii]ERF61712.1 NlpC/P60 family protein [Treponema socranskii subsp. socranskii VPI DR56BR1116 = ATCC 35536]ERK05130.1 NlpC/P60 family protein [Treponema socranskii subsp. socranskii VPI DR56BR1116 = ATCC 35536]
MMKRIIIILLLTIIFVSCNNHENSFTEIDCPDEICARAFKFAELYKETGMPYELGGQSPVRSAGIDCSGLVVMCYKYAVVDTKYNLLFGDASANAIYMNYSTPTKSPRRGDLVFMGEASTASVTHIAIFDKIENETVYFIDSTLKDTDGDGNYDINGVSSRDYGEADDRIKAYGRMRLAY